MKPLWILSVLILTSFPDKTPVPAAKKIQWLTLQEVQEKMKEEPRPVIIDLYAKWCYWCKVMDKKTYNNDKVAEYINENFYAVKLDAETKQTLQWKDEDFNFNKELKMNEFSLYLTRGQLSFPTTAIFGSLNEAPASIPGFMEPNEIEPILKYFGEEHYKTRNFQEFLNGFKRNW